MEKTVYFCTGMPRSGSTLLMNILGQNPRFAVTATSGVWEMVRLVRGSWDKASEMRAMPEVLSDAARVRVLRGMVQSFHANVEQDIVFDKSRGWIITPELAEIVSDDRPLKFLVSVRPVLEVLSSCEKLYRKAHKRGASFPKDEAGGYQTVANRVTTLLGNNELVGAPISGIRETLACGYRSNMYFVEFDRLTRSPNTVMSEIYEFLDEEPFPHDFENVAQITSENDRVYGWGDLHTIRPAVKPVEADWEHVLAKHIPPQQIMALKAENEFWKGK